MRSFSRLISAAFVVATVSSCFNGNVGSTAGCCLCLLSHDPDGSDIDAQGEGVVNCIAGDGDFDAENQQCSNQGAEQIVEGDAGSDIEVASDTCATTCEAECTGINLAVSAE